MNLDDHIEGTHNPHNPANKPDFDFEFSHAMTKLCDATGDNSYFDIVEERLNDVTDKLIFLRDYASCKRKYISLQQD
jgi:hypothetical protein